jgi:hypothetical protein
LILLSSRFELFRKTQVDKFAVACLVNHQVLWLEVSVDDVLLMQVLQRTNRLGQVKRHVLLDSEVVHLDLTEQVTALDKLKLHVQVVSVLERCNCSHDEGTRCRFAQPEMQVAFSQYVICMLVVLYPAFVNHLEHTLVRTIPVRHLHGSEVSLANTLSN